jgi:hypothetical protein
MSPNRPGAAGTPPANRPPAVALSSARSRSAATNRPASRWNANTPTGRRCRDLYRAYLGQLGNPADPATQALVLAAAESVVLAEIARQDCLRGLNGMTAELMIRLENTANRSLRRIGLNKPVPVPRKTFHEKMAEREAAQKAAEAKAAATSDQRTDEAGEAAGGAT